MLRAGELDHGEELEKVELELNYGLGLKLRLTKSSSPLLFSEAMTDQK